MKNAVFFLLFLLVGLGLIIGFFLIKQNSNFSKIQNIIPLGIPTPTTTKFSLENAPSNSISGNITNLSGDVSWQSRIATEGATIKNPQSIQQGEDLATGKDGKVNLEFTGYLNIEISPQTELGIIQTLPVNFVFSQNQGIVKYTNLGNSPISVRSQNLLINIESGNSTISIDPLRPYIYISVNAGSTTVGFNNSQNVTKIYNIASGKEGVYNYNLRRLTIR